MKKIIVAGLIAIGCLTATAAPSLAQSATVVISDRGYYPHRHHDRFERYHDRRFYGRERVRHFRGERCRTSTVKFRHHGRWVVERRTVCR
ncbi:hypothetical protein [Allorhizobium terrae]|uniref:Uncharacterized protein n=1 Tax=Allorhizobium terrae TaxID=1848972 RepID=A0A4S4A1H1_9HYPH|nr:hypothetical protein [Allorhizobium terrae]THF52161.1 hypothetical protein E6C51_04915 [Allorhizobium terrae]TWD57654.1 hypothetical protein FB480_101403 [Agrobacterium vitis]